jgi:hypothetical protein
MQLVPIISNVVSSNPFHGEVHSIQHYKIKFDSDLQLVTGFPWEVQFATQIKLTAMYIYIFILQSVHLLYKYTIRMYKKYEILKLFLSVCKFTNSENENIY